MAEENKTFSLQFKDGHLLVKVDSDLDGQSVLSLDVDLSEVAEEIISHFKK